MSSQELKQTSQLDNIKEINEPVESKDELKINTVKEEYYSKRPIPLQALSQLIKDGLG
jgi:hypothetical protein